MTLTLELQEKAKSFLRPMQITASLCAVFLGSVAGAQKSSNGTLATKPPPPKTWVDPMTGHRVTRLTDDPHTQQLFFNRSAFTMDGRDMIYLSGKGICDLDLLTQESTLLVPGKVSEVLAGTKTRTIYYRMQTKTTGTDVLAMNLDTKQVRLIGKLPALGTITTVNADETMLAGTAVTDLLAQDFKGYHLEERKKFDASDRLSWNDVHYPETVKLTPESRIWDEAMLDRYNAHTPEEIFTLNLATGKLRPILQGKDWLANVLFSPTDPNLLLYAHEGPSALADRVWTIRADGSQNRLMHTRTEKGEAALNEFWSPDGKAIWFELERPVRTNPFLVSVDVESGRETMLHLSRNEAALHFAESADGSMFAGGGRNTRTEKYATKPLVPFGEQYIEVLQPVFKGSVSAARPSDSSSFRSERLVDLGLNNYVETDPNTRFSPDGRYVIFTSDLFGPRYIFSVAVAKESTTKGQ